jgi:hypothetical protein
MRSLPVARPAMAWPHSFPYQCPCSSATPCDTVSQQYATRLWMTLGADRGVLRIIAIIVPVMGRGGEPRRAHPMARTA